MAGRPVHGRWTGRDIWLLSPTETPQVRASGEEVVHGMDAGVGGADVDGGGVAAGAEVLLGGGVADQDPRTRTVEGAALCGTKQRIKLCAFNGERESMKEPALIAVTLGACLDGPH